MIEPTREETPIEKVAAAIRSLTYGDLLEVSARIRDIIGDRSGDGEDMADSRTYADILHSWAEAVFIEQDSTDAR